MPEISGYPYQVVEFTKKGVLHKRAQRDALLTMLDDEDVSDLILLSHGWNNNADEATALYTELLANFRQVSDQPTLAALEGRKFAVAGVLWPSKKFTPKELQPGGGASGGEALSESDIRDQLEALKALFHDDIPGDGDAAHLQRIDTAISILNDFEDKRSARDAFVEALLPLLGDPDAFDAELEEEMPASLFSKKGHEIIDDLADPGVEALLAGGNSDDGGVGGGASLVGGLFSGARRFLNLFTYYKMKTRAGVVGAKGVCDLTVAVNAARPGIRIHLIGHSFGGRVVAAAAKGRSDTSKVVFASMSLLQAAFSHSGFAPAAKLPGNTSGFFRDVVDDARIAGPVIVTHTKNDRAVGLAYPLASRLSRDALAAIGDEDDKYGGIGRNGARHTNEADFRDMLSVGAAYELPAGRFHNLLADAFISDHSDVRNATVAYAVASAIAAT